jgi:hypothetical protein
MNYSIAHRETEKSKHLVEIAKAQKESAEILLKEANQDKEDLKNEVKSLKDQLKKDAHKDVL